MCNNFAPCGGCSCHQHAPCNHCLDDHDGTLTAERLASMLPTNVPMFCTRCNRAVKQGIAHKCKGKTEELKKIEKANELLMLMTQVDALTYEQVDKFLDLVIVNNIIPEDLLIDQPKTPEPEHDEPFTLDYIPPPNPRASRYNQSTSDYTPTAGNLPKAVRVHLIPTCLHTELRNGNPYGFEE